MKNQMASIENLVDDKQSNIGATESNLVRSSSCVIVGSGTLAMYCAQQTHAAGHMIKAVLATDTVLQAWATREGIYCADSVETLNIYIRQHPVDWLFSIANPIILPASLIEQIREGAFNYHNAPLPRYAGSHATSWALLAHESHHAISWHRIAVEVDAGHIAVQRPIAIDADDTALTLNLKCYQAAREGFLELLTGLGQGSLTTYAQAMAERSFYAKYRRPTAGAYLRWTSTAQDLSALARALDFGELYVNPLGCPKLLLKQGTVQVSRIKPLDQRSGAAPGTVVSIGQDTWQVATGSEDVLISGFATLEGELLSAQTLATQSELRQGKRLPKLTKQQSQAMTEIHEALAPSELFWQDRLARLQPLQLPFEQRESHAEPEWVASAWCAPLREESESNKPLTALLSVFAIYLARLTGQAQLQMGWSINDAKDKSRALTCLAPVVPMEITVDLDRSFAGVSHTIETEHALLEQHRTFIRDLIARYPTLHKLPVLRTARPWRVAVSMLSNEVQQSPLTPSIGAVGELLTLQVNASGAFRWIYDANRLDANQVQRMNEHLRELSRASLSIDGVDVSAGKLNLLAPAERKLLLQTWNATERDYPTHQCIHQLFEQQVERSPQAPALVYEDQVLSYAELNAQANCLAHQLIELGVQPDARVAICVERSPAMVVGVLAILKAGGAYVPLDPAYPSERLTHILADAVPTILLADAAGRAVLSEAALTSLTVLDPNVQPALPITNPQVSELASHHLAYVIYTSGSTGTPKGVMIEHRGVVNLAQARTAYYEVRPSCRVLQFASLSFDVSVGEIFMALSGGASLYLPPDFVRHDRNELWDYLDRYAITHVTLTPALLQEGKDLPSLSTPLKLILVGEALSATLLKNLSHQDAVFNDYGPTETTVYVTAWRCSRDFSGEMAPIGRPIGNARLYLLDTHGQPVPLGAVGELYIGGVGVARGYLNRPELTAERFLSDPFSDLEEARMYKTGDLARYLPDGNLVFLGRNDHQLKIRGFRIEPGEIEARLLEHPQVREAAVLALGEDNDKRLIAYVVAKPDEQLAHTLRSHLAAKLPEYMTPAAFVRLDMLPLTPNGKLDRRALPAPNDEAFARHAYEAPQGEIETALAAIWAELLKVEQISRHDNFFALGGHSLLAVQMITRIRTTLDVEIALRTLFEAPTVAGLAQRLLKLDGTPDDSFDVLLPIQPKGAQPPLFCVHPAGGLSWSYIGLSKHLDTEQPVYGLQARGLNGVGLLAETIDAMASDYIRQIRHIQPKGPYYLLGWSFGGRVAHSIATQLEQQGERVALLALLDSYPDYYSQLDNEPEIAQEIAHIKLLFDRHSDEGIPNAGEHLWEKIRDVLKNNLHLSKNFSPLIYCGDILLFRATIAEDESTLLASPDSWKPYVLGNIEVYDIHCKHKDMHEPTPAMEIGRILAQKLDELKKRQPPHSEEEILVQ